jgi:hypothetical protein
MGYIRKNGFASSVNRQGEYEETYSEHITIPVQYRLSLNERQYVTNYSATSRFVSCFKQGQTLCILTFV